MARTQEPVAVLGTVAGALNGGPIVSPWPAAKLRRIADGEYATQFALSHAAKDGRRGSHRRDARAGEAGGSS